MNKKDIALLALVAGVGILISYFSFDALFKKIDKPKSYKVVKIINSTIDDPRSDIFTENSINPTVEIWIGDEKIRDESDKQKDIQENEN